MINQKVLADAINAYKKEIPLPLKLKEVAEDFTDLLFKVLFDTQTDALEGIKTIHDHFEEMVALACWKPEANCQNWKAHYKSTGPEIWRDTQGKVTHFVSSMGTGGDFTGTIMGTSTYLKEQHSGIHKLQSLVGNTPLVLSSVLNTNPGVQLLFKLEGQNPGGSVKDRAALNMISNALERGEINEETPLIEATSGNTGIALAMIASVYGLNIELVMPENSTIERVQTMRAYGAKVTLTPEAIGIEGARDYAENKVLHEGYYSFNQFSNPDNWKAHYKSTGPEIWRDTQGKVTHFVQRIPGRHRTKPARAERH